MTYFTSYSTFNSVISNMSQNNCSFNGFRSAVADRYRQSLLKYADRFVNVDAVALKAITDSDVFN